jgi:hypothetical protein
MSFWNRPATNILKVNWITVLKFSIFLLGILIIAIYFSPSLSHVVEFLFTPGLQEIKPIPIDNQFTHPLFTTEEHQNNILIQMNFCKIAFWITLAAALGIFLFKKPKI